MNKISVRSATIKDVASISKLIIQLGYNVNREKCQEYLSPVLQLSFHRVFLAVCEEEVCGLIHLQKLMNIISMPQCEILSFIVDQSKRSQGIGKELLTIAEHWAKQQSLFEIKVSSNTIRERAHRFYLNNEYILLKTQHYFIKKIE